MMQAGEVGRQGLERDPRPVVAADHTVGRLVLHLRLQTE